MQQVPATRARTAAKGAFRKHRRDVFAWSVAQSDRRATITQTLHLTQLFPTLSDFITQCQLAARNALRPTSLQNAQQQLAQPVPLSI